MNNKSIMAIFLFTFLLISGCVQNKPAVNIKKCNIDSDCVLYIEGRGDPAGMIHCSNVIYETTCTYCSRMENIPQERTCTCEESNSLGNKYCIYRVNGEEIR